MNSMIHGSDQITEKWNKKNSLVTYSKIANKCCDSLNDANPMSTPPHIVPGWYFLPIYANSEAVPGAESKLRRVSSTGYMKK